MELKESISLIKPILLNNNYLITGLYESNTSYYFSVNNPNRGLIRIDKRNETIDINGITPVGVWSVEDRFHEIKKLHLSFIEDNDVVDKDTLEKVRNEVSISIIKGNIVLSNDDAIVNAANSNLLEGGGVCGAIFRAANSIKLQKECNNIGYCHTGEAVITSGCELKAKYVIHAVGPIYRDESSNPYLYNTYYNSLKLANDNNVRSISFPSISTGIYGFPKDKACVIALKAIHDYIKDNPYSSIKSITLYLFDDETYNYFKNMM